MARFFDWKRREPISDEYPAQTLEVDVPPVHGWQLRPPDWMPHRPIVLEYTSRGVAPRSASTQTTIPADSYYRRAMQRFEDCGPAAHAVGFGVPVIGNGPGHGRPTMAPPMRLTKLLPYAMTDYSPPTY